MEMSPRRLLHGVLLAALVSSWIWTSLASGKTCVDDIECDDGVYCNGEETCDSEGRCVPGTPVDCDDGIPCTRDRCRESARSCVNRPVDSLCDDGKFCNGIETCDATLGCKPGTPPSCDDGIPCTQDSCSEASKTCVHRPVNSQCDDGKYCNGIETCDNKHGCKPGTPPNCDDGIPCTQDSCSEASKTCVHRPVNSQCDDGKYCNGVETCDATLGCKPGTPPSCDDGIPCTQDSCSEASKTCVHRPVNSQCDDGKYCNGEETCDATLGCKPGTPPSCDDGIPCTQDSCSEASKTCVHRPVDSQCDDGKFCNGIETCDDKHGCKPGTPPSCDDGIPCTQDSCSEASKTCVHRPVDSQCDDGKFCNGIETCDDKHGCKPGTPPNCDDGIPCTQDSCSEASKTCVHRPVDSQCDDGKYCNGVETCDATLGCKPGTPPSCDDGIPCTQDSCSESTKTCVHRPVNSQCDDGKYCNGVETCDATQGCKPGTPPSCDDGIPCTQDSCSEASKTCVHRPVNSQCDDGKYCNGVETCDATLGCKPGAPPSCDDGIPCTQDSCSEASKTCVHRPVNSQCDDGKYCNGIETCDDKHGCKPGTPPNCDDGIPCTQDSCSEASKTCVHRPVNSQCDDGKYCNGVETCEATQGCRPGLPPGCDDGVPCTQDSCSELTKTCVHRPVNLQCDDGLYCNGVETCDATQGCRPGLPPGCDDGVPCTQDSCSELTKTCIHRPMNSQCDDGKYCNGEETCEATQGCRPGLPPGCDDGVPCTQDSCSEASKTCVHRPVNSQCDDGKYCNGVETCDATQGCLPGASPDCNDGILCTQDSCDEAIKRCSNTPISSRCFDGFYCNGIERCDPIDGCIPGTPPDCDDGILCTQDSCSEATRSCVNTPVNSRCFDGVFCNGAERCDPVDGCVPGTPPDCSDSILCTQDSCSEATRSCVNTPVNSRCFDGVFCNGAERCDPVDGCVPGTPQIAVTASSAPRIAAAKQQEAV
eukprot:jgi/Mesvir1/27763/Mv25043-RA.1